ncbi:MAG TPA: hypothetical protein PL069_00610 [Saprospiraceae bacterium]|jgi:hypothetical protein|nr:hypothetical protein [Saprospiraceae bacterium]
MNNKNSGHRIIPNINVSRASKVNIRLKVLTVFCTLLITVSGIAQNSDESHYGHQHDYEHQEGHEHHKNEIGVVVAPAYFTHTREFNFGLHLHYLRSLGESKFGVGAGYERIFGDHAHHFLGVVAAYRPTGAFSLILSPGLAYEDAKHAGPQFGLHIEAVYEFDIKGIHIGPVFEFSYDADDIHISPGIHIGIGF